MALIIEKPKTKNIIIMSFLLLTVSANVHKILTEKGKVMQKEGIQNKAPEATFTQGLQEVGSQGFHGNPAN